MEENYRVEFYPQMESNNTRAVYESYHEDREEAAAVLNAIAKYTLMLHECSLMPDYSNMGRLFEEKGCGWVEIDDDGNEI